MFLPAISVTSTCDIWLAPVIWPNANCQTLQILQNKSPANFLRSCANPVGFARVKRSIRETVARGEFRGHVLQANIEEQEAHALQA